MNKQIVLCADCGRQSDRGFIALCRSCTDERANAREHTCENCDRVVPSNQWVCERCFGLFDGERFHNELLGDEA